MSDKNLLSVTGYVLRFAKSEKLTKKGKPYWNLKLTNGFEACVFREAHAKICDRAVEESRPLIIDYESSGRYSNIDSITLASAQRSSPEDEEGAPF